ncbi:hypothetical protein AAVH_37484 [Aphelenchoides avenae]|nr:hypothetical protein AAVH_37484 [Aphelenchus avenae]
MPKQRFRDSILNMIGEFVALNKNPDFHLTQQSAEYIAEAIRDEIEKTRATSLRQQENYSAPIHFRASSTQSAYRQPSKPDDACVNGRRLSVPNARSHPQRLLQRFRSKKAHGTYEVAERQHEIVPMNTRAVQRHRKASLISESDESPCSTRRGSHAEDFLESVAGHIRINPSPF